MGMMVNICRRRQLCFLRCTDSSSKVTIPGHGKTDKHILLTKLNAAAFAHWMHLGADWTKTSGVYGFQQSSPSQHQGPVALCMRLNV